MHLMELAKCILEAKVDCGLCQIVNCPDLSPESKTSPFFAQHSAKTSDCWKCGQSLWRNFCPQFTLLYLMASMTSLNLARLQIPATDSLILTSGKARRTMYIYCM
jgi:hypothetical protein